MIVEQSKTLIETNSSKEISFKLDESSISMIFDTLINLYANKYRAVFREVVTNAVDASIEATKQGLTVKPVSITLPTSDEPNLIVQDFGVGMSMEQVEETYAAFGASTKRKTNAQIGGFGIGRFSALSITDQFTVESIKNGEFCAFSVTKGRGLVFLHKGKTSKDNGVIVKIPIKNTYTDFDKIKEAVLYYENLCSIFPISVNGILLKDRDTTNKKLFQFGAISVYEKPFSIENRVFEIGGVLYSRRTDIIPETQVEILLKNYFNGNYVISIPTGAVDINRSREYLETTDKTKDYLLTLFTAANQDVSNFVALQEAAMSSLSVVEWFEKAVKLTYGKLLSYKGVSFANIKADLETCITRIYMGSMTKPFEKGGSVPPAIPLTHTLPVVELAEMNKVSGRDKREKLFAYFSGILGRTVHSNQVFLESRNPRNSVILDDLYRLKYLKKITFDADTFILQMNKEAAEKRKALREADKLANPEKYAREKSKIDRSIKLYSSPSLDSYINPEKGESYSVIVIEEARGRIWSHEEAHKAFMAYSEDKKVYFISKSSKEKIEKRVKLETLSVKTEDYLKHHTEKRTKKEVMISFLRRTASDDIGQSLFKSLVSADFGKNLFPDQKDPFTIGNHESVVNAKLTQKEKDSAAKIKKTIELYKDISPRFNHTDYNQKIITDKILEEIRTSITSKILEATVSISGFSKEDAKIIQKIFS